MSELTRHTRMSSLEADLFVFLSRKYVQQSSERQRSMNLKYMTAETHDLARELAVFIESLSAPKSGESESGPARSDSRHSRQGPQPTVDDSHEKDRDDEGKQPTPAGKATSALDESNQESPVQRLGDSVPGQPAYEGPYCSCILTGCRVQRACPVYSENCRRHQEWLRTHPTDENQTRVEK